MASTTNASTSSMIPAVITVVPILLLSKPNSMRTAALPGIAVIANANPTNNDVSIGKPKRYAIPAPAPNGITNAKTERTTEHLPAFRISSGRRCRPARNIRKNIATSVITLKDSEG